MQPLPAQLSRLPELIWQDYKFGMIATDIRDRLLSLDAAAQAETAGWLIDLLDGADPTDHPSDSLTEAVLRGAELSSGEVAGLSREEFCHGLRHG